MADQKTKLLTVDDEADIVGLFKDHFELKNYEVFTATRAEEGLQIALKEKPRIILLDLGLPDHPGSWVLENVKKTLPDTLVVILSASVDDDRIREKLTKLGCDLILEKDQNTSIAEVGRQVEALVAGA